MLSVFIYKKYKNQNLNLALNLVFLEINILVYILNFIKFLSNYFFDKIYYIYSKDKAYVWKFIFGLLLNIQLKFLCIF